ncbi:MULTISPECIES: DNA methyltransferase [unclassified Granulicatella]|uniref:DNA methyltransferase n=1 Tax=unclassified Granulicatella TaxID=2630493 RepID=UPI001073BC83|nr:MULTISPECIES: DNA methyltransferase [unclassified Granulicatella]MBF0781134.1 DNA methyltransferase [Granulicatella sp. 19428wC4_WM01]TFU91853.1 DNA methyltransferase [Granulicatella sp. WM01]
MIVWSLFDSGNGCYNKVAREFEEIDNYSIGLDQENKNTQCIQLNLADYSYMFRDCTLFSTLDSLPCPDLIVASPPCESWSTASGMRGGNACWKQEDFSEESLFVPQSEASYFTIRTYKDYEDDSHHYHYDNQFIKRINGELCIFNTIKIIKKYNPKYYIIENPAYGRIWRYIREVIGFNIPYDNLTRYNNYNYPIQKPTKFASNTKLNLKNNMIKATKTFKNFAKNYNDRSNIPLELIREIFTQILQKIKP